MRCKRRFEWLFVCGMTGALFTIATTAQAQPSQRGEAPPPAVLGSPVPPPQAQWSTILGPEVHPIDLNTALHLAGVQNPDVLLARQVVVEAVAQRQLAAAQCLPSINAGSSYNAHSGVLQQSNGNILSVNRSSVYVGSGSFAVAAGTVLIPGVVLSGKDGDVRAAALRALVSLRNVKTLTALLTGQDPPGAAGHGKLPDELRQQLADQLMGSSDGAVLILRLIDTKKLEKPLADRAIAAATEHPDVNIRLLYENDIRFLKQF